MIGLLRITLRLPFITMAGITEAFLGSLREMQAALEEELAEHSVTPSRQIVRNAVPTEGSAEPLIAQSPVLSDGRKLYEPVTRTGTLPPILSSVKDQNMDHGDDDCDVFFSDRTFVKTYEFVVTYTGENGPYFVDQGYASNDQDTSKRGIQSAIRQLYVNMITNATVVGPNMPGVATTVLPPGWRSQWPNFIAVYGPGVALPIPLGVVPVASGAAPPPAPNQIVVVNGGSDVMQHLGDFIEVSVKPMSRNKILSANDPRRQAKAMEGIETVISRIEERGLKTRDY